MYGMSESTQKSLPPYLYVQIPDDKCEYDEARPDLPCNFCSSNGLGNTCVKVSSPSSSRHVSVTSQGSNGGPKVSVLANFYEEQNPNASFEDILKQLSRGRVNTNTVSGLAAYYEQANPGASFDDILTMINDTPRE